jgi:hypothetical protein
MMITDLDPEFLTQFQELEKLSGKVVQQGYGQITSMKKHPNTTRIQTM